MALDISRTHTHTKKKKQKKTRQIIFKKKAFYENLTQN